MIAALIGFEPRFTCRLWIQGMNEIAVIPWATASWLATATSDDVSFKGRWTNNMADSDGAITLAFDHDPEWKP